MILQKAQELREELVTKICDALEKGTAPWQKPWIGEAPHNAISHQPYHGINQINLSMYPSSDPRWLTFQQAKEKGWNIKKGAKGTHVEFYKFGSSRPVLNESGETVLDESGKPKTKSSVVVKTYVVFHASQVDGISEYEPPARNSIETHENAEKLIKASRAVIRFGGNSAYYRLMQDYIQVPEKDQFVSQTDYYATILHELAHWTGHPLRLNRDMSGTMHSKAYAREELVAEIASVFISAETGIPQTQEHIDNHAAYVQSWLEMIRDEPKALFKAISQAQKVADFLKNIGGEKHE